MKVLGKLISKRLEDMFFWKHWQPKGHNRTKWYKKAEKRGTMANVEFYNLALYYYKMGYEDGKRIKKQR